MLKPLGLYVHIPFCVKKCAYCDFNSYPLECFDADNYVSALIEEIDNLKKYAKDYYLDTIFFGGGTPSLLNDEQIKRICEKIKFSFYIDDNVEWSMECNPGTVSLKSLKNYRKLGINRISMGVQSLKDKELKTLGRIHKVKEFMEAYTAIRVAGFENFNFDLIFSLPDQTLKDFTDTLEKMMLYSPPHLSLYSLQLEEGTKLYNEQEKYQFPTDEENRLMYEKAKEILGKNGYVQYEISNFAKEGFESKHNLKYWSGDEYLGIGAGASSYFLETRYDNPETVDEYINFAHEHKLLFSENNKLSKEEQMSEFMFMGLRKTKGINNTEFKNKFGVSFFEIYKDVIEKHLKSGLLIKEGERIFLSSKGLDLANTVMCDFV